MRCALAIIVCVVLLFISACGNTEVNDLTAQHENPDDMPSPEVEQFLRSVFREGKRIGFGSYMRDSADDIQPITWDICEVDKENKRILLVCCDVIDAHKYTLSAEETVWEDSELRHWLNSVFYDVAFADWEKSLIVETTCYEEADYIDKVFIPSYQQAKDSSVGCRCKATQYAYMQGLVIWKDHYTPKSSSFRDYSFGDPYKWSEAYTSYWLMPETSLSGLVGEIVGRTGKYLPEEDISFYPYDSGVRPAIWVNIG